MTKYLRTQEAAKYVNIPLKTFKTYVRLNLVPFYRPTPRTLLFTIENLDLWVENGGAKEYERNVKRNLFK